MSKKAGKLKAAAQYAPQDKDACAADIATIGARQRELLRLQADMNDQIGAIAAEFQPRLEALQTEIEQLQKGVHLWCSANRNAITDDGKVKTANLVTGEVAWRKRPPSVKVTGEPVVLAQLKGAGLTLFIRTSESVDKEMILGVLAAARGITAEEAAADESKAKLLLAAAAVSTIAGLRIVTDLEDFSIVPFEQELAAS